MGEITLNRDAERVPLSSAVRKKQTNKRYNYYGASGVIDKVDNYLFEDRLLLVGEDGANLLSRSKDNAFFAEGRYWVNNHAHVIDSTDKLILDYVAIVINSTPLDKYITGSAQPKFTQDNLNNFPIPLPPLAEQRRIVAEVEKWFALIDDLETNKQDLQSAVKQVRAKVLDLAIHGKLVPQDPADEPAIALLRRINPHYTPSDTSHYQNVPFDIPASWEWVRLDDVLTIMNGYAFKSSKYISNGGVRIIRITNVQDGYVCDDSPLFYLTALVNEYSSFLLKEGDLLMSLTGNVGRVGLLQREMLPAALNQRVACLREKQPWGYLRYIFYLLRTTFFLNACVASGNATAQLNISTGWLKGFLFPLPPLAEQKRIVSEIERIFGVLGTIEENIR